MHSFKTLITIIPFTEINLNLYILAMNFAKIIAEIEETQNSITQSLVNNKSLLHSVQETFAQNLDTIQKEVGKLDTRINAIPIKN